MTTVTSTSGNVSVTFTLYGTVTLERLKCEMLIAQHRAEQLNFAPVKVQKARLLFGDRQLGEA